MHYADGSLQEAAGSSGGTVRPGTTAATTIEPATIFIRASGGLRLACSVALPTRLWRDVSGFDPHFRPAYCEDVDWHFAPVARPRGLFQPQSRIVHYEGRHRARIRPPGQSYQIINTKKLYLRWRESLARHIASARRHTSSASARCSSAFWSSMRPRPHRIRMPAPCRHSWRCRPAFPRIQSSVRTRGQLAVPAQIHRRAAGNRRRLRICAYEVGFETTFDDTAGCSTDFGLPRRRGREGAALIKIHAPQARSCSTSPICTTWHGARRASIGRR